ncbi:hypothetical protein BMS3Bbin04_00195 [bacterium BMS3Bbin04]|nr:hypothetical protein BMS3Bbin04_00195 [bacterium BMS3Bbin04]
MPGQWFMEPERVDGGVEQALFFSYDCIVKRNI